MNSYIKYSASKKDLGKVVLKKSEIMEEEEFKTFP